MQMESGNGHRRQDIREKENSTEARTWSQKSLGRWGKRDTSSTPFPPQPFLEMLGETCGMHVWVHIISFDPNWMKWPKWNHMLTHTLKHTCVRTHTHTSISFPFIECEWGSDLASIRLTLEMQTAKPEYLGSENLPPAELLVWPSRVSKLTRKLPKSCTNAGQTQF